MKTVIDVKREKLIRLVDVPKLAWLPWPLTAQAVHGWWRRGVRGVRLETVAVGGTRCTSEEALGSV